MSKMGLPYLPRTLVWTKLSLDKYSPVYPTYLSKKLGHFEIKFAPKLISSSSSSLYLEIIMLLYKYGHPYLPTYHKIFCPNFFFGKSMAGGYPTYLQYGHMSKLSYLFFIGPSPNQGVSWALSLAQLSLRLLYFISIFIEFSFHHTDKSW